MAYKMKGFSGFKNSPVRQDLTKKSGLGPREKLYHQSKEELQKIDKNQEQKEDAAGVSTNIKIPKVHKDGPKNRIHVR